MTLKETKTAINFFLKKTIVLYITTFYKPDKWYAVLYKITCYQAHFKGEANKANYGLNCAYFLNSVLALLTRKQIPFAIPIKEKGFEILKKGRPNGLVICSLHIPLCKVALRYMIENGYKPDVAIAAQYRKITSIAVWGITDTIPTVATGPFVFVKAKKTLQQGGSVVALVDQFLGSAISPNIFSFAHQVKAGVVCFLAELLPDGTIEVSFFESLVSNPDKATAANLQVKELGEHAQKIVSRYQKLTYKRDNVFV